jgi:hypothetical protein
MLKGSLPCLLVIFFNQNLLIGTTCCEGMMLHSMYLKLSEQRRVEPGRYSGAIQFFQHGNQPTLL